MAKGTMLAGLLVILVCCISQRSIVASPFPDCPVEGEGVSRIDRQESSQEDAAPTPSPTASVACVDQTSNARGHYTSTLAPCKIKFHTTAEEDPELIDFQTSNLCSVQNDFLEMKEYVAFFPDECVGDFNRCYSLEHNREVLFEFLCEKGWDVPPATTHISIDCTEDKELVLEAAGYEAAAQQSQARHQVMETYELKVFNVMLVVASFVAGLYFVSQWIVRPFVRREIAEHSQLLPDGELRLDLPPGGSPRRNSTDSEEEGEQIEDHFALQIPADFDAVPMVPAIILDERTF